MKLDIEVGEKQDVEYAPLPTGWYPALVETEDTVTTDAGDEALTITFLIEGKGRTVKEWYNLNHSSSEQAREISTRNLESLGRACGMANIKKSEDLVGHKLDVKLEPDGSWNRVKDYRRAEKATQRPVESNGSGDKKPPWLGMHEL